MTLWNGLCRYLLDVVDGWDKAYVAQHVSGFEELAGALDDPAWQLDEVARSCGSPVAICSVSTRSLPVPQDRHPVLPGDQPVQPGVDKANAIINAHLMCGRIGKPGRLPSP